MRARPLALHLADGADPPPALPSQSLPATSEAWATRLEKGLHVVLMSTEIASTGSPVRAVVPPRRCFWFSHFGGGAGVSLLACSRWGQGHC